jgi:MerR family mercuric resistance operon transcriptional regulator
MKGLSIGQLARSAGVATSTVRYYERSGLLKPETRAGTGQYRQYGPKSLEKLKFIKSAQAVGLSLKEVADLLRATEDDGSPCDEVMSALRRRLESVRQQMADLRRVERTLSAALNTCCVGKGSDLCQQVVQLKHVS